MLKSRAFTFAAFTIVALGLGFALTRLLTLRYERGDVYPPYSTLRADPLGTKAFFEALSNVGGFEVERNYRPLELMPVERPVNLIYAGVPRLAQWREPELTHARGMLANGSRLVFAFTPEGWNRRALSIPTPPVPVVTPAPATDPAAPKDDAEPFDSSDEPPTPIFSGFGENEEGVSFEDALEDWGANFAVRSDPKLDVFDRVAEPTDAARAVGLDQSLSWHSALYFKNLKPEWRVLFRVDDKAVIIERTVLKGSIVLVSDPYFLSNEALSRERRSALLEWIAGVLPRVIFDEEHLGVTETRNFAGLARKYRLGAFIGVLGFLAVLYLWKNAVPFLPRRPEVESGGPEVQGKDAEEGLIKLLRRNLPRRDILRICGDEWLKSAAHEIPEEKVAHVQSVLRAHQSRGNRDIAAAYRTIAEGLNRRPPNSL